MNLYRSGLVRCAVVAALVAAASIAAGILAARAEDYPTRPVKIIVQTAAGSSLDAMGRLVAEQLSQFWGKEVLVINQAGAGGLNAARATADAVADAGQAETIALNRYRIGLVSYLDVVYAETAHLGNQRMARQIEGQRMVATVVLIKALGGGWLGVPAPTAAESQANPASAGASK